MMRRFKKVEKEGNTNDFFGKLKRSSDFIIMQHNQYIISYIKPLVKGEVLQKSILPYLPEVEMLQLEVVKPKIPIENKLLTSKPKEIQDKLLRGFIAIELLDQENGDVLLLEAP